MAGGVLHGRDRLSSQPAGMPSPRGIGASRAVGVRFSHRGRALPTPRIRSVVLPQRAGKHDRRQMRAPVRRLIRMVAAWDDAAVTSAIAAWQRPAFRPTGRKAAITLIAFADEDVLDNGPQLQIRGAVPQLAPIAALDLRMHRYADSPAWIDAWRMGALRTIAARQLDNTAQYAAAATHV